MTITPLLIGLTGGIATGKSIVAAKVREMGYPVIDADSLGHRVLVPDHPGSRQVIESFGTEILDRDGHIDRKKLGQLVFQDREKLRRLNAISHPFIAEMAEAEASRLATLENQGIVFLEAALLIEADWHEKCAKIWVVLSSREHVLQRLSARDGISFIQAMERIEAQLKPGERVPFADVLFENNSDRNSLEIQVEEAVKELVSFVHQSKQGGPSDPVPDDMLEHSS